MVINLDGIGAGGRFNCTADKGGVNGAASMAPVNSEDDGIRS
jgi:hypothetical protein